MKKTAPMFPLRDKTHTMISREEEKYTVNFANTERFKKSSIPYMQNELNNQIRKRRNPG